MEFLKLILSIVTNIFRRTTNEKDEKTNVNGQEEINAQGHEEKRYEENVTKDEEVRQEKLQVIYMITLKELLKGKDFNSLPKEHQNNLMVLLERVNKIRSAYNKAMTVTSGYRSMDEHIEIYRKKGITDTSKIPMKSKHLSGEAVDIYDPNKQLQQWILQNVKLLEEIGLWCEDFSATKNWVHFQILPPASGKRFFMP